MQQRLATLKDAVAAAQRVAAAREAAAAAAIQRNAAETAAQLQKQDVDKQISQSEQEAKVSLVNPSYVVRITNIPTLYLSFSPHHIIFSCLQSNSV
jgi:hypothetical protein